MSMNLPNRLTCLRVLMIPFFVLFMILSIRMTGGSAAADMTGDTAAAESIAMAAAKAGTGIDVLRAAARNGDRSVLLFVVFRWISFVIFCAACFTDFLDGFIARRQGLVTDFGKFMDPLADKLLVCSALILLTAEGSLASWIVIIIIAREFVISGFRLVAADNGIVIAASWWGKCKTVSQMLLCMALILPTCPLILGRIPMLALTVLTVLLTVISLIDYMRKNIRVITDGGF